MSTIVHLTPDAVPQTMRGTYSGKMFKAEITESVTVPAYAGNWDGGSRDTYTAIEIATGRQVPISDNMSAPWDKSRQDVAVAIAPGFAVVRHSVFCGKDMGLTFYVHPDNAARWLPAPVDLSEHEMVVLRATKGLKSSYGGMDRYQLAERETHFDAAAAAAFPTRAQWDAAKQSLIGRGMLNKAGAITVAGRNAIPTQWLDGRGCPEISQDALYAIVKV